MQNDLISRSERLRQIRQTEPADYGSAMMISDAKKMIRTFIEEAPAVDAVEVVRCKDCAKCDYVEETPVDCGVWICHLSRMLVYENHFCSYGKRRADDGK